MGIIKAKQLVHEYIRRDEEGNVESIQTALDHIDLDVQPVAQTGFSFRAAFTTAREAAVRFFLNPHGFAHTFQLLQHGVNHWLWSVQCLAYLGRFHTAP